MTDHGEPAMLVPAIDGMVRHNLGAGNVLTEFLLVRLSPHEKLWKHILLW
jgi:hypothetical protein